MTDSSTSLILALSPAAPMAESLPLAPKAVAISKAVIRQSLAASTNDGVFATIFSTITGGVLLSNFLIELQASPIEIGMIASLPMVANLVQPLGAIWGDRVISRHNYCFYIYTPARLIWLLLVLAISLTQRSPDAHLLLQLTLLILFMTHFLGALGSAAWLSWLAALVPRRLRGRYFSIRNSAANLTCLLVIPAAGWVVAANPAGSLAGYGLVVAIGVLAGLISLAYQSQVADVNPLALAAEPTNVAEPHLDDETPTPLASAKLKVFDLALPPNFLRFLLYLSLWMVAVNLSAPFFNLYMLDNLAIDIRWVTTYNSLTAGANLVLMVVWGRLADRFGNRALLIGVGILVALTPLLWLSVGSDALSLWLWLPLLHVLAGGTWAAIDLCKNNMQLDIAPKVHQAKYFAIAAAIAGLSGAIGTTVGSFLATMVDYGGLPGLFALSSVMRLGALLPLVFVSESRPHSLQQMWQALWAKKQQVAG